ncbi:MAG: hypothetical protein G01um101419_811, partial [Parcubacteria group bacterium Gr01-1014_19]
VGSHRQGGRRNLQPRAREGALSVGDDPETDRLIPGTASLAGAGGSELDDQRAHAPDHKVGKDSLP